MGNHWKNGEAPVGNSGVGQQRGNNGKMVGQQQKNGRQQWENGKEGSNGKIVGAPMEQ